ncbi:hypothetical protein ACVINW_001321 [Bradyrhizobium sp. USDA 4461]
MAKKVRKAKKRPETHLIENFKRLAVSSQAVLLLKLGKLYDKAMITQRGFMKGEKTERSSAPKKRATRKSRGKATSKK